MTPHSPRQDFADELRGFALLGIILVNAPSFAISSVGFTPAAVAGGLDRLVAFLTVALAQGKFYLLFSFLFGYSLSFAFRRDDDALDARRFRRRLLALGLLGVVHAVFFYLGDILFFYAVLGGSLLWLRRRSDRVVAWLAAASGVLWLVVLALFALASLAHPPASGAAVAASPTPPLPIDLALAVGSFLQAAAARLALWPASLALGAVLYGPSVLGMLCIGLLAGRRRLLEAPAAHAGLWRAGTRWALWAGLPLALLAAWLSVGPGAWLDAPGAREAIGLALGLAAAPLLTWGYVAWLAAAHRRWPGCLALLRPAGSMSLSCYLGESLLMSLIFCGYGAGLFGRLGAAGTAGVAALVWLLVMLAARGWQRRGSQGPIEWLLARWVHRGR